jgi:hypothetical protein
MRVIQLYLSFSLPLHQPSATSPLFLGLVAYGCFAWVFLPKKHCFCCYLIYLFIPPSTEAWKCDFLLATITPHIVVHFYAPRTKILEGRTSVSECVFESLFKGVST